MIILAIAVMVGAVLITITLNMIVKEVERLRLSIEAATKVGLGNLETIALAKRIESRIAEREDDRLSKEREIASHKAELLADRQMQEDIASGKLNILF